MNYLKIGVIQQMPVSRSWQQDQINYDDDGLEFDVFIGNFMAFFLKNTKLKKKIWTKNIHTLTYTIRDFHHIGAVFGV